MFFLTDDYIATLDISMVGSEWTMLGEWISWKISDVCNTTTAEPNLSEVNWSERVYNDSNDVTVSML